MKSRWILFTGLILLALGIVLKLFFEDSILPSILIVAGIIFKIYFIFNKIRTKGFKPGSEFFYLAIGLGFFFSGLLLEDSIFFIEPVYLKIVGILFKVIFIVLFIRKTKINK